jgi:imidazolonepropionase-like amidohydrolase
MNQKLLSVENIDVFCEKSVFDTEQSRRILQAGKEIGLRINFHGDELNPMKSAEVSQVTDWFSSYLAPYHMQCRRV